MKREPITYLVRSIWDCLTNPLTVTGGLAIRERLTDTKDLVAAWWKPCQHDFEKHLFPDGSGGFKRCRKCGEEYGIGEY